MKPFLISPACRDFLTQYPAATVISAAARGMRQQELEGLVRLWFSEGIPYAFRNAPMLYEMARAWLGAQLGVHPKFITIIGSGRLGYSLAPPPEFGRAFSDDSDLDFNIISDQLLSDLAVAFYQWKSDVAAGNVKPVTDAERRFWPLNFERVPKTLARGFIDERFIPRRDRYPLVRKIAQTLYLLTGKLALSKDSPKITHCSLRVYRDWDAFVSQMRTNFLETIQAIPSPS